MKSLVVKLTMVLLSLASMAAAQSAPQTPAPAKSTAQISFDELKTLAGEWEGPVTLDPPMKGMGMANLHVSLRVTSRGNAIVHELQEAGTPLDPSKYDHPVTIFYVDGDQLTLVHYCDAGNRPRMIGKPEGKEIAFDFADISGTTKHGHMHAMAFTPVDANHHTEDWTFMMPGDKPMHAHFDLHRAN